MKNFNSIYFLFLIILPGITFSQSDSIPDIITDRPTQTESPYLIPKGSFQIETGIVYTNREDQTDIREMWSLGNTLLRYGVLKNLEIRLASSYESIQIEEKETGIDTSYNGVGAVSAGFKVFIVEEKGLRPQIAIGGSITFRHLGHESFAPAYSYPVGRLSVNHNITKRLSLAYNIGFAYSGEDADGYFIYTAMLGYKISNRFWCFAEVYGKFDNGDFPNHRLDGGFTYLVRRNLQLDISGGYGLSSEVDRYFLSTGLSWRIPR